MKNFKSFIVVLLAIYALSFCSCSKDEPIENVDNVVVFTSKNYVGNSISNDGKTVYFYSLERSEYLIIRDDVDKFIYSVYSDTKDIHDAIVVPILSGYYVIGFELYISDSLGLYDTVTVCYDVEFLILLP